MRPEFLVGEVGFGPSFSCDDKRVAELEAEVAKLIKHRNMLRRALERCAALSADVSDEKHEALLATAP